MGSSYLGRQLQVEYEKNRDFRPMSGFISETMPDGAIVIVKC